MNLILKNFKENLINKYDISPKIANVRAKKLEKILENNSLIEHFKNLDDLNEKITPKINEIIKEEIEELKKEKNLKNPEIEYVSVYSEKKHIIDVYVKNKNSYLLISFEIFARKENMSIEIFEVIKEENISSENFSVTLLDDNKKEILRKYISIGNSHTAFDTERKENDFILKNLVSENKVILNEIEYKKNIFRLSYNQRRDYLAVIPSLNFNSYFINLLGERIIIIYPSFYIILYISKKIKRYLTFFNHFYLIAKQKYLF